MSGVLAKKLGRKYSPSPEYASSETYSVSSQRAFFQVKYVYDWLKPIFARWRMTARRVNASARNTTSRSCSCTLAISHCQNGNGLVCGLSTRNTFTPQSTHPIMTSRSASHSPRQSGDSQLTL